MEDCLTGRDMNLAAFRKKPRAQKRHWRVATHEDGAFSENRGRGDSKVVEGETATWEEPGDCPRAGPATSLPEAKEKPLVSYAQSATHESSPEQGGSERMVERHTDPDCPMEKRTHPVARLPDPEEADDRHHCRSRIRRSPPGTNHARDARCSSKDLQRDTCGALASRNCRATA
ncbi:hypothetical protein E2C01_057247 [Portunus trituberculatus]|uniref:Uncharacterized protein n=1 Tax=Portunus trituberculatus TaxID=210409 RepID=A0A5B7GZJ5_PORTR|nr:hypothetical protein [Portunus trituberculatus]